MDKKAILVLAALLLVAGSAFAPTTATITRSFSAATIARSSDLTVTLTVTVANPTTQYAYAIDENIPAGWAIKSPGSGATDQNGHLKWVEIQSAASTTYSYVLTAPSTTGTATFSGDYRFSDMNNESPNPEPNAIIGGQTQVTVSQSVCPQGQITSSCTCGAQSYSSGYCCSGAYQATACVVPDCNEGAVAGLCSCGGQDKISGYCCSDVWQNFSCSMQQCPAGEITGACVCGGEAYGFGYCCGGEYAESPCTEAPCTSDLNCSSGQKCCSGSCKTTACGAAKACQSGYECKSPDACAAKCSKIALKKFSIDAPAYFVLNDEFTLVVNDTNGNPVEGATATYAGEQKTTVADGSVSFTAKKSQYVVTVKKTGYVTVAIKRVVKTTGSTPTPGKGKITITLPEVVYLGEEFSLQVNTTDGNAVEGAAVTYGKQETETDTDGQASLTGEKNAYVITVKSALGTTTAKVIPKTKPQADQNKPDQNRSSGFQIGGLLADPISIILIAGIAIAVFILLRSRGGKKTAAPQPQQI